MADVENVIIIGSGPAGYTAALYTARANLNPLVIEGFLWGGLLQQTTDVENYPGYPEGIMGPEMMQEFRDQAERFGTRFITDNATKFEPGAEGEPHKVWIEDDEYQARAVILAMGAEHKKLGVPGEEELGGRGVSYCATCDAAFYKDSTTIIVGGGDSAMEEAIFLAKFSRKVTIVNRRDEFRASKIMLERAAQTENIEFLTPYVVDAFLAGENGMLDRAQLRNAETGETARAADVAARSSRSATSRSRRSSTASSTSTRAATSKTEGKSTRTNLPGVFAAGDLVDHTYRQAVTAAGSGCQAALDAEWYLRDNPSVPTPKALEGTGEPRRGAVGAVARSQRLERSPLRRSLGDARGSGRLAARRGGAATTDASRSPPRPNTHQARVSPDFKDGGAIPVELTCDGAGRPPTITWRGARGRSSSCSVVPTTPTPTSPTGPPTASAPRAAAGSRRTASSRPARRKGKNSAGKTGWTPPCPPEGDDPHHYVFTMYALEEATGLADGAEPDAVRPSSTARSPAAPSPGPTSARAASSGAPGSASCPAGLIAT